MKRKEKDTLKNKSTIELSREIDSLRKETARFIVEKHMNLPKDTNLLAKKRNQLAILLSLKKQKSINKLD